MNINKLLSTRASKVINDTLDSGDDVMVSAISAWEIAMLINKGRLIFTTNVEAWFHDVEQIEGVHLVPVDAAIGIKATILPGTFHKDPADRIIVATARTLACPLVTADKKISVYNAC